MLTPSLSSPVSSSATVEFQAFLRMVTGQIGDVMDSLVQQATPATPLLAIAPLLAESALGCVVITQGEGIEQQPVGIITSQDMIRWQVQGNPDQTVAGQIMCPPVTVKPETTFQEAYGLIQQPVNPYLVVVGDQGELLGVVGQGQLLALLSLPSLATSLTNQVSYPTPSIGTQLPTTIPESGACPSLGAMDGVDALAIAQPTVYLLQNLIHSLQVGIILCDRQGRLLLDNGYLRQLTGYPSPNNLYHLLAVILAEPAQYQTLLQELNSVIQPEEVKSLEITVLTRVRQLKTVMVDLINLQEQDLILTLYYDISEQKQAEQELRSKTQQLREIQAFAHLGSWRYSAQTQQVQFSDEVLKIFGIDPQRLPLDYAAMGVYFSPKELARRERLIQRALRQGIPYATDFKIIRSDGSPGYIFSKGQPVLNDQQEVIGLQGILMDVTDRKLAEEALKDSEARFQKLAATLPGILFTAVQFPDGTIRFSYCSPLVQERLGIAVEQVLADSHSVLDRIHPQDLPRYQKTAKQCVTYLTPFNLDLRLMLPTGQWQWLRVCAQPEYLEQGHIAWYGVSLDITAQKQAEAERDEYQERLSLVLQGSNDGWWDWNLVTGEIYISPRWWQMVGYQPNEMEPEYWCNLIHPEDLPNVQTTLNAFLADPTRQFCEVEYRLRHKQGHYVPVFSRGLTLRDDQGNPLRNVGTNTDLSLLKCKEQQLQTALTALQELNQQLEARVQERTHALADSQHFVEGVLNTSPSLIYLENVQEGHLIFVNQGCYALLGYTPEELMNLGADFLTCLIHPADLARVLALGDRQRQGDFVADELFEIEYRIRHRTGEWRWFVSQEIVFSRDGQGKALQVLGNAQDISDRKAIELKNQQLQERLQFVLSANPAVIFTCRPGGDYGATFVSQNISQILGYRPEDLLQNSDFWISHVHLEDRDALLTNLSCLFEQGHHSHEYRFLHEDGHYVWVQNELRLVKSAQGNPLEIVGCLVDISDRKASEKALQESYQQLSLANEQLAQAARLKDEFLANMSHELRTPLNAILGLTEALQEQTLGELNVKQLKALKTISESGQHLLSLINDILDLSKISAGKMELEKQPVSLSDLCESCLGFIQPLAHKKAIQVKSAIAQEIRDFVADERRLRQILLNLLNNAVKFTPQGGEVELIITLNGSMLQFQVRDTGIGIAPAHQTQLFQSFVQIDSRLNRQYEGTGLGLVLVRKLTELHGGQVAVQSELGQGSCFTVIIPYEPSHRLPLPRSTGDTTNQTVPQGRESPLVLMVDDQPANLYSLSDYLIYRGYQLITAEDGETAIALAQQEHPDLILMDMQMPGMGGLEATRQIRSLPDTAHIPIIALTALAMPGDRERCLAAGVNDYVSKPVRMKQLIAAMESCLYKDG